MRTLSALVLLAIAGSASAAVQTYRFEFTVVVGKGEPIVISATVPPGTKNTLQASDRISFEVETPTTIDDSSVTTVKIIDNSTGSPVVLGTSQRGGSAELQRRFTYLLCGSQLTFVSPTRPTTGTCGP